MKSKILILGGTEFVGRQLVEELIKVASNEIYLFNRGKTNPDLFPTVNRIIGDRETDDLKKIGEHEWDYIIDFSSYFPKSLQQTLLNINKNVKKYIYISTISVYDFPKYDKSSQITEDFTKKEYEASQLTEPTLKFYGEKKAACEAVLNETVWLNAIILRPSIIYGKYDPTDRMYYWLEGIRRKEKTLTPANGENKISITYSEDLMRIILNCMQEKVHNGSYNCATHPPMEMVEMLQLIKELFNSDCKFESLSLSQLKEEELTSRDLPVWFGGNLMIDHSKISQELEIEFTPFKQSLQFMMDYYNSTEWHQPTTGMTNEKEQALLKKVKEN